MRAYELENARHLDPLIEAIGNRRIVMLGEASHGTAEYYNWRKTISKRLIEEKGFNFIAVEGDWPDCYEVNRYVKGYIDGIEPVEALKVFDRWPTWMWGNWEVAALAKWLKEHNAKVPAEQQAGFYGLDVYSLHESLEALVDYLSKNDGTMVETARRAFRCFEPYFEDPQQYAISTMRLAPEGCEREVLDLLGEIRRNVSVYDHEREASFNTDQNALVAVNAERYYRAMLRGGGASWNVRDQHMDETLQRLLDWHGPDSKAIIWAHNTHIGDARATDMARAGMVNIGQLARDRYGEDNVYLVGFGSYQGTVLAGDHWGAPVEIMNLPPARSGSWEDLLYRQYKDNRLMFSHDLRGLPEQRDPVQHRAVGVVYHPENERYSNYVPSLIHRRYDAFIFLPHTQELKALELHPDLHKVPDTYPWEV